MRKAFLALIGATGLTVGCSNPTQPVADYFSAQKAYATELNKQVAQPPLVTIAAPPLFVWDLGWVLQGNNGLGICKLPAPQQTPVNPLPPSDAERTFSLGGQVPAAITNGIVSANVDAHYNSLVILAYTDVSGQIVGQADLNPVLQTEDCKKVLAAASGNLPITIVKGQIIAKQQFTWEKNSSASLGAKIAVVPGVDPVGFSISGSSGPDNPLTLTENTAAPHFLILQTFQPIQPPPAAAIAKNPRRSTRTLAVIYQPVATPIETQNAIQNGVLGGMLPSQRVTPTAPR